MSEWTAPGGSPAEREPPRYGELAPAGWTPPPPDPSNPHGPAAWAPPPRPGLLPLRPLTLGEVIAAAFQVIRRNPRPTFGFALVVSIAVTAAVGVVTTFLTSELLSRIAMAAEGDQEAITAGSMLVFVLGAIGSSLLESALVGLVQGIVSLEVARGTLGERLTLRQLWTGVRGRFWLLVGWTLLEGVATLLLVAIVAAIVIAIVATGPVGILLAIPVAILLGLGAAVLYCWLTTKLAFVPVLLVVERLRLGAAIRRSWSLTTGSFWRIFGIVLLITVVISLAAQVVTVPITAIGSLLGGVLNPNGAEDFSNAWVLGSLVAGYAVSAVFAAVSYVATAATPAILYVDVRMRKEGLDVELQRTVERMAAGERPADPFRSAAPPPPPAFGADPSRPGPTG